jgi:uncharacterized membrane protein YbhN (UPF0104 family)
MPQLIIGFLLALVVAGAAYRARSLSTSGAIAAAVLGTIVFGLGGLAWAVLLLAFFITATVVDNIPGNLTLLVQFLGALLIVGLGVLVWIVRRKQHAHSFVSESRWAATLRHVIEGLHLMGNRRTIVKTTMISGLYLGLQIFSIFALMRAYGMDLSFWAAGGVLAVVRFAIVVPNAPGNLGLYQFAIVLALACSTSKPSTPSRSPSSSSSPSRRHCSSAGSSR